MNRKMAFFLILVFAVLAFALFNPYGISAAGPKQYKIIEVKGDTARFEREVTTALNDGWSLAGGVSITDTYYAQAVVK